MRSIYSIYAMPISFQLTSPTALQKFSAFPPTTPHIYIYIQLLELLYCNIVIKWKSTSNTLYRILIPRHIQLYTLLCVLYNNFSAFCPLSFCYFVVCWMDIIWLEIKLITFSPFLRGKLPFGASAVCIGTLPVVVYRYFFFYTKHSLSPI